MVVDEIIFNSVVFIVSDASHRCCKALHSEHVEEWDINREEPGPFFQFWYLHQQVQHWKGRHIPAMQLY